MNTIKAMRIRVRFTSCLVLLVLLAAKGSALAVQAHGGAEGLVSHQIGHTLFIIGMVYMLFRLSRNRTKGAGWLEFKLFLCLIIAWNIVTFSGHLLNEFITADHFIKATGVTTSFTIFSLSDAFYYLSRLDHLLLVPSFIFLFLALKKWRSIE